MRLSALALSLLMSTTAYAADIDLAKVTKNQKVQGFRVESVYTNDAGKPIGARFTHANTGFTLDLLQIESVPQAYTWVNSWPTGDQGEPHTQEHLLLGKGTTGRAFASLDTMWLSTSSAFTQQWRTSYFFNTSAGRPVFFDLLSAQLNALLNPNYSDEEIRREVRNFGVSENPDGTLRLEEKGSVYNEMVSSTGNPYRQLYRAAGHLVYGQSHPLAYNSGGEPSGIRTMKPEDIRKFHHDNYYLANMGTIAAFPNSIPLSDVLAKIGATLDRLEPKSSGRKAQGRTAGPAPAAAPEGSILAYEYPQKNEQQPSPVGVVWPANRELNAEDQVLAELFFDNLAGDPTTNLYKLFIDSRTRKVDIGTRSVFSDVSADAGGTIMVGFSDVAAANLTDDKLREIRSAVTGEIARIAALPDDSPELKEFNDRIRSRIQERRRDLARFVNSPPGFGARNTRSTWMDQLLLLERTPDFKKSVTLAPQLAAAEAQLAKKGVWRDLLAKWKVTGVTPYIAAARPSPALIQREEAERQQRSDAEAAALVKRYSATDVQSAIRRYRTEYDAAGAEIEKIAAGIPTPEFTKNPPMTLDDGIVYDVTKLGTIKLVSTRFDNMTSATLGAAFPIFAPSREQIRYLSLLPQLMTRVGVIENGKPVSYETMSERMRNEILSLDAYYSTNPRTERVDFVLRGSGIGNAELKKAIGWMSLVAHTPDWRPENLPRIRDVVDQQVTGLRNVMQGSEESWVQNPATAYRMQTSAVYLAADSSFTRAHNALRLRWLLKEVPEADSASIREFTTLLATGSKASRAELRTLLASLDSDGKGKLPAAAPETHRAIVAASAKLSPTARALIADVAKDLDLTLNEIPDSSLDRDWVYLCEALRDDLLTPPSTALATLEELRKFVVRTGQTRMFFVSSGDIRTAADGSIKEFASSLGGDLRAHVGTARPLSITNRMLERETGKPSALLNYSVRMPVYVGLVAPNMKGGVMISSVPSIAFGEHNNREKQIDFLASRLFAGYGAHGIFLKTIGAGLAYSNGLRASISGGRSGYYAERTPELPQTLRFVTSELKNAPRNPKLADYAIAQAFGELRSAASYESRAEGIAADLADFQPPDLVRKFHEAVLELRKDPTLGDQLFDRKDRVYAQVVPGYAPGIEVPGSIYFAIGPDRQLDLLDQYLKTTEGSETVVHKLYPRDFWLP
jgi:Zn-dependent M16 (insulinase) family peptidase